MSFSGVVKGEISRLEAFERSCMMAELAASIRIGGNISGVCAEMVSIKISTENAAFARRVFTIIKKVYASFPQIIIRKSKRFKRHTLYLVVISEPNLVKNVLYDFGIKLVEKDGILICEYLPYFKHIKEKNCCRKSYLRGAFLAAGALSDPEKTYHLELATHNFELATELETLFKGFGFKPKIIKRKGNYITYLKEGENIVDFLNIIGAHNSLMQLENVRIVKEMRNNVNRIVNCETANLEKTVNASIRQIENINYIINVIGLEHIPDGLRDIARLRLECPDASLKELGQLLNPRLGRSGVNHRLKKLDEIAQNKRQVECNLIEEEF